MVFVNRMVRAAKLDAHLYEEIESDRKALGEAVGVVVLSSLAAGVGAIGVAQVGGLIGGAVTALVGWLTWSLVTYVIGTKVLPGPKTQATYGELLRTIGFSSAPGMIRVLGVVPGLTELAFVAASIWMLAAMVVAVRQALDYTSTARAVWVCVIGWIVQVMCLVLLVALVRGLA